MEKKLQSEKFSLFFFKPLSSRVNLYINFYLQVHFKMSVHLDLRIYPGIFKQIWNDISLSYFVKWWYFIKPFWVGVLSHWSHNPKVVVTIPTCTNPISPPIPVYLHILCDKHLQCRHSLALFSCLLCCAHLNPYTALVCVRYMRVLIPEVTRYNLFML